MSGTRQTPNRTASADFIDNQLPGLVPAFDHPRVRFDPKMGGFAVPSRPAIPEVGEMKFWAQLFPECMVKLQKNHPEPDGRQKAGCSIRCEKNWNGVRSQLEKAQSKYDVPKRRSAKHFLRKGYRKVADHTEQLQMISKVAANVPYISPFMASVNILLDIAAAAAKVRQQATTAFEPEALEDTFENIEIFIATFPDDPKLRRTAIDLVVAIFNAIENAIGFFLSYEISRVCRAVIQGPDYGHKLTGSIEEIQSHGNKLKSEGEKAAMHRQHATLEELMKKSDAILAVALANADKEEKNQQLMDERTSRMLNHLLDLLQVEEDRHKQRIKEMEEMERKRSEEVNYLLGQLRDERQLRNTPSPQPLLAVSPWVFLAPQGLPTYSPTFITPQLPTVPWLPIPATTTQMPITWLHKQDTLSLLDAALFAANDVQHVLDRRALIAPASMRRAEAALKSDEFRKWLIHPSSRELLIQGDLSSDDYESSGISLLSALVYSSVVDKPRHICLAWFCSLHDEPENNQSIDTVGGYAIASAFIIQILRQCTFDPYTLQQCEFSLRGRQNLNLSQLCSLLERLLRKLPQGLNVIIIIDEIGCYETEDCEQSMLLVLRLLLSLARDRSIACMIKILGTSTQMTDQVYDAFQDDDDCVLDFDALEEVDEMEELEINDGPLHSDEI